MVNKSLLDSEIAGCLKIDGANPSWADQDMGRHRLRNLKDVDPGSRDGDAVNKKYVDDNLQAKFDAIAQADLNMNNNVITKLAPPSATEDAVNKRYVDEHFVLRDGTRAMYGDLTMGSHKIKNLVAPAADKDAANKVYVDQAPFLKLAGGQMARAIDMRNNELVHLKDPAIPGNGFNKKIHFPGSNRTLSNI